MTNFVPPQLTEEEKEVQCKAFLEERLQQYCKERREFFEEHWNLIPEERDFKTLDIEVLEEDGETRLRFKRDQPEFLQTVPPLTYARIPNWPNNRQAIVLGTHLGGIVVYQRGVLVDGAEVPDVYSLGLMLSPDIARCELADWEGRTTADLRRLHALFGRPTAEGKVDEKWRCLATQIATIFETCTKLNWDK